MFNNKLDSKCWKNISNLLLGFLRQRHFVIVTIFIILLFIFEGFFLYNYFYKSLTQTKALAELRQQSSLTELKLNTFENLTKFYAEKQKKSVIDWDRLRDPFAVTVAPENKVK